MTKGELRAIKIQNAMERAGVVIVTPNTNAAHRPALHGFFMWPHLPGLDLARLARQAGLVTW